MIDIFYVWGGIYFPSGELHLLFTATILNKSLFKLPAVKPGLQRVLPCGPVCIADFVVNR